MNFTELESERRRTLTKYIGFIVISFVIMVSLVTWIYVKNIPDRFFGICGIISILLFIFSVCNPSPKLFENKLKEALLPSILENIAGDKGKVLWKDEWSLFKNKNQSDNYEDNIYNNYINSVAENISSKALINKVCSVDEVFYGKYADVMFNIIEYYDIESRGKSSVTVIRGNILEIPLNIQYYGKLVIKKAKFYPLSAWEHRILKGLTRINCNFVFTDKKLKIYTNDTSFIEKFLTTEFIEFINNLPSTDAIAITQDKLYLISNANRDKFKLGSLYKNVNDEKQYAKFETDLLELLNIVETASKLNFVKTIDED